MSSSYEQAMAWLREHPIVLGIASGGLVGLWAARLDGWSSGLQWGIPTGVFVAFIWRPDGPAHRFRDYLMRRFPKRRSR